MYIPSSLTRAVHPPFFSLSGLITPAEDALCLFAIDPSLSSHLCSTLSPSTTSDSNHIHFVFCSY